MILDLVRERIVILCVCTTISSFLGENHATNSGFQLFFSLQSELLGSSLQGKIKRNETKAIFYFS